MTKFAEVKKYSCYTLIRALLVAAFMILVVADVAARQFTLVIDAVDDNLRFGVGSGDAVQWL